MSKHQILIVENHEELSKSLADWIYMELPDCSVCHANHAEEAIWMIQDDFCDPQVIITDLFLVGMDGIEFTRRIENRWPDKKTIVISVYDNEIYRKFALKAGAADFRVIPNINDDFMSLVRGLLNEKKEKHV
ncbi:MAG: response regulator [Proteobacteria bacterium]|nr:response regulator [Pseudomonadota bacterium]